MDTTPPSEKPLPREFEVPIAKAIVFSLLTCGLYGYYWKYTQFRAMNALLGREEFDFVQWILLTLLTCGIYDWYYEYKLGSELQQYLAVRGRQVSPNLGLMGLVLSVFGIWRFGMAIVVDAVYQHELNQLAR